ncbi:hypothetical protein [Thauera aromatica]|uniref:Uncharacterized protein n=1 Tax=Thauera aromatica K172 TaxID=44139 RepID=A0A2R4BLJ5_THAAR|nr:hypothetical protein [Thauera aromatica]AVR88205.1 hypothetical protein Tharo_1277 [Thauera aromatica K172]MCK2095018.1 hypothetical protein [Thauera aromatica]
MAAAPRSAQPLLRYPSRPAAGRDGAGGAHRVAGETKHSAADGAPPLTPLPATGAVEVAVAMVRPRSLQPLFASQGERAAFWHRALADEALARWLAACTPTRLHVGSEFCERLLPTPAQLTLNLAEAGAHGLGVSLLTPVASPQVIDALAGLLPLLPAGAEVVVSDWGVALLLQEHFPQLTPVAGRILCRMLKDPRLGDPRYAPPAGHDLDSPALRAVLRRLNIARLEMDLPLFARDETFSGAPLPLDVHLPFAFVAKGRMCRTAGLARSGPERFSPRPFCHHECLGLRADTVREAADDAWHTVHVGNTVLCRHSPATLATASRAAAAGRIARLIVPGEAV